MRENGFGEFHLATPNSKEEEEIEKQLSDIRSLAQKSNCKVSILPARDMLKLFPFFKTDKGYWVIPIVIKDEENGKVVFILHNFDRKVKAKYKRVAELLYAIANVI